MDRYQLHTLQELQRTVSQAYQAYSFARVYTAVAVYLSELSAFYFDVSKDRLYAERSDSPSRRACQTVLHHVRGFRFSFFHISLIFLSILTRVCSCWTRLAR